MHFPQARHRPRVSEGYMSGSKFSRRVKQVWEPSSSTAPSRSTGRTKTAERLSNVVDEPRAADAQADCVASRPDGIGGLPEAFDGRRASVDAAGLETPPVGLL